METWVSVKGSDGTYSVSNLGRVRSESRVIVRGEGIRQRINGRILKTEGKGAYSLVCLGKPINRFVYVHRLVAEAFVPNPNNLPEVNHKDLNKRNNQASNLEWTTHKGNKVHAVNNGVKYNPRPRKGEDSGTSKLTWKEVRKIRALCKNGVTQREASKMFGITPANVHWIVNNKTWMERQAGLTLPEVDR